MIERFYQKADSCHRERSEAVSALSQEIASPGKKRRVRNDVLVMAGVLTKAMLDDRGL